MIYQRAGLVAIIKRIVGWIIFIPALLSTTISVINFIYQRSEKSKGVSAIMLDFIHLMTDMIRFNTAFLNIFWRGSPVLNIEHWFSGSNLMFLIIYFLIFVGMALQATGARMSDQIHHIREGIEDQLIVEQAKGNESYTRVQLEEKVVLPRHSIFSQIFILYILPVVIGLLFYFIVDLLGLLA